MDENIKDTQTPDGETQNTVDETKNGIIDGVYYENGVPTHKGVIITEDGVFYAGRNGVLVKGGHHNVHREMSNGLLKRGTYKFDDDGRLIEDYYKKPVSKNRRKIKKYFEKKKKEFKSALTQKKVKKNVRLAIFLMAAFALLVVGIVVVNNKTNVKSNGSTVSDFSDGSPVIILPHFDEPVYLCSEPAKNYYKGILDFNEAVDLNGQSDPYSSLDFTYSVVNYNSDDKQMIILELSPDKKFSDVRTFYLDPNGNTQKIDNLVPDTEYFYRAYFRNTQKDKNTYSGSFRTAKYDRFIFMDGASNIRDIGGTDTFSGKTVRYGMLIRGSELDGLVDKTLYLKDPDSADEFGFVYEMDLREKSLFSSNYVSRLGKSVKHAFYEAPMYGSVFNKNYYSSIRKIFSALADENNYPMYLHCTNGKDRAGTIIFLLQGVLGVSDDNKDTQFLLSKFLYKGISMENIYPIYNGLDSYKGKNTNEKIVNFLVNEVGVPQSDINGIREILLQSE